MKKSLVLLVLALVLILCAFSGVVTAEDEEEEEVEEESWISVTEYPIEEPTVEPIEEPTIEPTVEPIEEPTIEPTVEPIEEPTIEPTVEPTEEPIEEENGYIDITSEPTGASVTVDGIYYGTSPISVSFAPGYHVVTQSKNGYSSVSTAVNLKAGETVYVDETLVSLSGYLSICSRPSDASVYIDDVYYGQTDDTFMVSAGTHTVALIKSGYAPYSTKVSVGSEGTSLMQATLKETTSTGFIQITSNPPGASIFIDDIYLGVTPNGGYLDAGPYPTTVKHTLQLNLAGYEPYMSTFSTSTSSTPIIAPTLVPTKASTGTIHVTSSPVGASVAVDEKYYGTTPISIPDLNPGTHTVKISAAGYADTIQSVTVNAGQYVELPVTLFTESSTQKSPAPLLGVLAGLAAAGVFCILRRRA